ncbi:MAG: WecB/TagA/CpsF family glycosyltransferase [bacterium]|nr:MAG: WecB/TagA/CpsF family glycosyltransferase [bacterium]
MKKRIELLGYLVDNLTTEEILQKINQAIKFDRKLHIIAINTNKFYQVRHDSLLSKILRNAEIVIPEYAFVWASKVFGKPLVEHIGGIMLMRSLLEASNNHNFSFYFLGAKHEVIEMMVSNVQKKYGRIKIAGWHHGYFSDEDKIIRQINNSSANILFVAMGVPRQEYFIYQNKAKIQVPIMMGVGGSFDVFAGIRRETPSFLRYGFEWIFRLVQDPKNLGKRYFTSNPYFLFQVMKHKFTKNGVYEKSSSEIEFENMKTLMR